MACIGYSCQPYDLYCDGGTLSLTQAVTRNPSVFTGDWSSEEDGELLALLIVMVWWQSSTHAARCIQIAGIATIYTCKLIPLNACMPRSGCKVNVDRVAAFILSLPGKTR